MVRIFLSLGLNTERYEVSLLIQPKCGKIWTRITPNTDTFNADTHIYVYVYTPKNFDNLLGSFFCQEHFRYVYNIKVIINSSVKCKVQLEKWKKGWCPLFSYNGKIEINKEI